VPLLDHLVRAVQHYIARRGSSLAAAVTYFAFLSFFPLLALAFATIGLIARFVPEAQGTLDSVLREVFPGMIGDGAGQLSLSSIQHAAGAAAGIGVVMLVYSGLNWVSEMRDALVAMFDTPPQERPGLLAAELRDLLALVLTGVVLLASVAVSGVLTGLSERILDWVGLNAGLGRLLAALSVALGVLVSMVLFFMLFTVLVRPTAPPRALWSGALLGALGFELLKQLSRVLLASTVRQPAFQAFGIALILLVWIYYFSRVVMYAAAWAHTAPATRLQRETNGGADN
jgi:membrane protein